MTTREDASKSTNTSTSSDDSSTRPMFVDITSHTDAAAKSNASKWTFSRFIHTKNPSYRRQENDLDVPLTELKSNKDFQSSGVQASGVLQSHSTADLPAKSPISATAAVDTKWSRRKEMLASFSMQYAWLAACHGTARVTQNGASWLRRLVWFLLFCGSTGMFFYQSYLLIDQYTDFEFQVDVEFSFNRKLAFPAVTFCNLNPMKSSALNCSRFDTTCSPDDSNGSSISINGTSSASLRDSGTLFAQQAGEFDFTGEPISSGEYLKYGFHPEDMLIECTWNGMPCNAGNFTVSQNPFYGNCFTINGNAEEPLLTNLAGAGAGLILELFVDPREGIGGDTSTSSGVRMSLHQPGVKPFPEEDGFSLSTGYSASIGVRQLEVTRLGGVYSNCTQQSDNWLSLYPGVSYSRTACVQSCLALAMYERCGCVEVFLVGKPICYSADINKVQADCVATVRRDYLQNKLNCDSCHNPCVDRIYLSTLSQALWPASGYQYHFRSKLVENNFSAEYLAPETYREFFLRAEVYFEELNYQRIKQTPAYPSENLIADFGGQMGLWAGLSALAFVELADFLGQFVLILVGLKKAKLISRQT